MLNSCCKILQTPLPGNAERELSSAVSCPREEALGGDPQSPALGWEWGCRGSVCSRPPPHHAPLPHFRPSPTAQCHLLFGCLLGGGWRWHGLEWGVERHPSVSSRGHSSTFPTVLSGAEMTSPDLESLPSETGKSGANQSNGMHRRPGNVWPWATDPGLLLEFSEK